MVMIDARTVSSLLQANFEIGLSQGYAVLITKLVASSGAKCNRICRYT